MAEIGWFDWVLMMLSRKEKHIFGNVLDRGAVVGADERPQHDAFVRSLEAGGWRLAWRKGWSNLDGWNHFDDAYYTHPTMRGVKRVTWMETYYECLVHPFLGVHIDQIPEYR